MKEELISFETAKLAKEKGFDLKCIENYDPEGIIQPWDSLEDVVGNYSDIDEYLYHNNSSLGKNYVSAPTQSLLQKWLREEYNIHITVWLEDSSGKDFICSYGDSSSMDQALIHDENTEELMHFTTYELALEKGLQEALKLIK